MSHLLDYLCKSSSVETEDYSSLTSFQEDMENLDLPITEDKELMSSEFFDSVFWMEQQNLENIGIDSNFVNNICSDFDAQSSPRSSESGDSVTLGSDSSGSIKQDEIMNINQVFSLESHDIQEFNKPEPEKIVYNTQPAKFVLQPNTKRVLFTKPINTAINNKGIQKPKQQLIRVQSLNGNRPPLLLPVNVKNVKKFKIINANDLKMENIKVTTSANAFLKKQHIEKITESTDDEDQDHHPQDSRYPPLNLTSEEKRLLMKEGIKLPSHYPLTKNEEKELKRIRRKIRNKISAQDSRKRKKEYVDKLEEKAKRTTEENEFLKKRIKLLRKQNSKLMEQMRKLQAVLFNTTSTKAAPTTCLMIVLFSTLLVCLPNLRLSEKQELGEQQLFAARRALLFNQKANNEEDVNMDEFLVFNKDDEVEIDNFVEDESENATENDFNNFLSELTKRYANLPQEKNCSEMNINGNMAEFCRKYDGEIKSVIHSMKEFLEGEAVPKQKGFIEPDISDDDEDYGKDINRNLIKEEPPSKRIKLSVSDVIYQEKASDQDLLLNFMDRKQE
ncbi:uncharacterized protein [Onthophagus taurus]|uniref:uncharacterized protein n=1 Tax=Onthophagus taurus TaxID=166361 RepID=UPI000C20BEB6|nr:uncharacterized protein LOC111413881 [Onthophagus taurus]